MIDVAVIPLIIITTTITIIASWTLCGTWTSGALFSCSPPSGTTYFTISSPHLTTQGGNGLLIDIFVFWLSGRQWLRDAQHFHPRLESLYPALWETCEEFGESYPFQTLKSMVSLSTLNTSFSGLPLIENSFWGWRLPWATCKREAKKLWWRLRRKVIVFLNSGKQDKEDRNLSKYNQTTASKYCQSRSFIISTQVKKKLKKILT